MDEKRWNDIAKRWKGVRTGNHDMTLDALGYARVISGPSAGRPSPPGTPPRGTPPPGTPETWAIHLCYQVRGLISEGLISHHRSLNETYWRQVDEWLKTTDAGPELLKALDGLIDEWCRLAFELDPVERRIPAGRAFTTGQAGVTRGVWDLMETAGFKHWMDQLIAAAGQYREACAALRRK